MKAVSSDDDAAIKCRTGFENAMVKKINTQLLAVGFNSYVECIQALALLVTYRFVLKETHLVYPCRSAIVNPR